MCLPEKGTSGLAGAVGNRHVLYRFTTLAGFIKNLGCFYNSGLQNLVRKLSCSKEMHTVFVL